MRRASIVFALFAASIGLPLTAPAATWDTSGNSQLTGTYYFRQVLYASDGLGNVNRALAYYGNITFNGNGGYSATGVFLDSSNVNNSGVPVQQNYPFTGTYSVALSGYGVLTNPLLTGSKSIYFLMSNRTIVGADTEDPINDMFVATPMTPSFNNSTFNGTYTVDGFLPYGDPRYAADDSFQLTADGAGHLGTVNITGYYGLGQATAIGQSSSNVTYFFSNGAAVIVFPNSNTANFYSGQEYSYFSPDGNFIFGGSPISFDMFVGVRNAPASTTLNGLYYQAGIDEDESGLANGYAFVDSYYGALNASQGTAIGHRRLLTAGYSALDVNYATTYPASIGRNYTDNSDFFQYAVGASGIRVGFGIGPYLGINVALPFTPPAPSSPVYLEPTGVVNAASSAPFTTGISPGDFLTFYNGSNLAGSTVVAQGLPFPTTLGKVMVLFDGIAAPLYYVSATQISVIVPYGLTNTITQVQVVNNGVPSNTITVYVNRTSPGVFTFNPVGGTGYAAILHGDYTVVSPDNPAKPGEFIAVFLTGLGTTNPAQTQDGAAGPSSGDALTNTILVDIDGNALPTPLPYAGLAPGLAGLYQVNFQVPATTSAGDHHLGILGPDSYSNESIFSVGTASSGRLQELKAAGGTRTGTPRPIVPSIVRTPAQ